MITWSISTTVRNPERIRSFLKVLKMMEGQIWNKDAQERFQIMLIQYKFYGAGEKQFYNGLNAEQISLMDNPEPIEFEEAKNILDTKGYVGGGDLRGRQSYNPLEKMGLAYLDDGKITITKFGNNFLGEEYDLGDIFFKSLLKWQLPNPDSRGFKQQEGFSIKPFIGVLHLIKIVNTLCLERQIKAKGISRLEFALFAITLKHHEEIRTHAEMLLDFREEYDKASTEDAKRGVIDEHIDKYFTHYSNISNIYEYADNAIRYFRLTRYLRIRGNGWYVDLEPRREIEIDALLEFDSANIKEFSNYQEFIDYLGDDDKPELPWERERELKMIAEFTVNDLFELQSDLRIKGIEVEDFEKSDIDTLSKNDLKFYIEKLRTYRKELQKKELHWKSQEIEAVQDYIERLKSIRSFEGKKPIELEKLITLSLNSLNDAIEIRPNYPVGDDFEPTFTAPANKPDIECYYDTFSSICEVTMLSNRQQWYSEGQPVMRHLRDFENNSDKDNTYCIFVAPSIHRDTINTYWQSVKYEYEGRKQKIIPLTISDVIVMLEGLVDRKTLEKELTHSELKGLYDSIIEATNVYASSNDWLNGIPNLVKEWKNNLIGS